MEGGGGQPRGPAPDPARARRLRALLGTDGPAHAVRAPGRVNLMGDHTDYHDGLVLPMAIDLDTVAAAVPRRDRTLRVATSNPPPGEPASIAFDDDTEISTGWEGFAVAIASELALVGWRWTGADIAVDATVPMGAGLSSSASFAIAVSLALTSIADHPLERDVLAACCRRAEARALGVPVGLMDQIVALSGRAGNALELDCRTLERTLVPIPADLAVLVLHSGQMRSLATSGYAQLRAHGEALARRLGLATLRDATAAQVAGDPVGRHVVSENERVRATADALRRDDRRALAEAFVASHRSLREDCAASTPAIDALVDGLLRAGAIGARMTGGGFGGCVVALADVERAPTIAAAGIDAARATGAAPFEIECRSADGAGPVVLP